VNPEVGGFAVEPDAGDFSVGFVDEAGAAVEVEVDQPVEVVGFFDSGRGPWAAWETHEASGA